MNKKTLFKNIFFNNISQGLQFGSRWILSLVLISVLTIEDFAIFSFVYSFSNILVSVLPFGSSVFLISKDYNLKENSGILQDSIIIVITLFFAGFLAYLLLTPFFSEAKGWEFLSYGILLSFILSLNLVLFSFFKGMGKFKVEMYAYTFFSLCLLGFIVYLYFFSQIIDISFIFSFLIAVNLLVFVLTVILTHKKINFFNWNIFRESLKNIRPNYRTRSYFGMQEIVSAIYTQIGLLILFYIIDETTYGYYRALFIIIAPIFMITQSISQVVLSQLKQIKNNLNHMRIFFRKIQTYTISLGSVIVFVLFFMRDIIYEYINIEINTTSINSFYIILLILIMRFVFSNYEMLLVTLDMQKHRFWIMLLSAVVSIVLIFTLLPQYGLAGAFLINAIAYLIVLIGTLVISEKAIK